jgi:transcriptional regulator with XRE-family HTH domain
MIVRPRKLATHEIQHLRREGGRYLRELREAAGLSQRQLAGLVGIGQYTIISQFETGRGRIPPESYRVWAEALGVDLQTFVRTLLRYYDPVSYGVLFGDTAQAA